MLSWGEWRGALLALSGFLVVVFAVIIVQPGLPGELLLQSLRFHLIACGIGLAAALALAGARWRGLLLLMVMLGFGAHSATYVLDFQARRVDYASAPLAQFRFLSFNVLTGNPRSEELVEAIIANPPDVALIMETPGIESHLDRLAEVFPYRAGCEDTVVCDISLHSRYPFEEVSVADLPPLGRERLIIGRINVDGQRVSVAGIHLTKPYYDNVAEVELWHIDRALDGIEGPLVLAGDFNSASWTEPMAWIGREQGLASGPTQPATWPVRLGPLGVPIDNVFTRGAAQLISLESGESYGSNHRPLWATVGLYGAD
ncbi:endonuclease/exonuclease/phosphatase family protein [Devosia sp. XJ19-1]|uniref:Endonuclease/exonuclease/phosphatase family protein n=1 Tax=Devosia ureilytica TaxID=2952754 RepID=A0A9Q4AP08_9HYPH|nr:endonuclease/exonuclease/phosphatase family protein [Devosia ureilytica]MCP8883567.1 endonuclease/exonuclease/phosphatase family protein [Devosia ureilytica]MCP8887175.1 endonuclease/exonuclease/phosphatase family protein [Devosia ureilytica]